MSTQGMHSSLSNRFGFNKKKAYSPFSVPVLTGTYYNSYQNIPDNHTQSAGTARVVLNGYGLLLYGWNHTSTGTNMHNVQIPELIGAELDITVIGSGGYSGGGGSGGGAGAGGGRHQVVCVDQAFYLSTGSHIIGTSWNDGVGNNEIKNTRLYMDGGNVDIKAQHAAGPNSVSTTSGCNIYSWKGARRGENNQSNQQGAGLPALQQVDTQLEYAYAGVGGCLPAFGGANCGSQKNGGDIGGGGGATDCQNYGGSCNGGSGGRYGFSGGPGNTTAQSLNGYGPVGGRFYSGDTYRRGGGGSFGGGIGDGGNGNTTIMGGGGAILIRWDTYDLGNFQAKENWPPNTQST